VDLADAAERRAVPDRGEARGDRVVDLQRAGMDDRRAAIGLVRAEDDRAAAVLDEAAAAGK
jgi:hypothetical protein